jgi:hypothetical protein
MSEQQQNDGINNFTMNKKVNAKDGSTFYSKKIGEGNYANLNEKEDGTLLFRINGNNYKVDRRSSTGSLFTIIGEDTVFFNKRQSKHGEFYSVQFKSKEGGDSAPVASAFAPKAAAAQPKAEAAKPQKYKNTSFKR